jgi:DNA-binding winged helix-turn-helix (wHTH) protein/tetratricopeptide (TPR) repeat protein
MNAEFPPDGGSRVKLGQSADFDIGGLRVSPARRQIQFGDETRTLEPRVMQVLVALAGARPGVISRDQLAQACWGGLSVGDDAINRCIVALRRLARGFDPKPFRIETIPRVGYSLREAGSGENASAAEARTEPAARGRILPAALLACALLVIGLVVWHPWQRSATVSVAVAPASPESGLLARDLTAKLGMLGGVTDGVDLLDNERRDNADLLFQVAVSVPGQDIYANLMLVNDRREVLWSKDFRQPRTNLADLKQQLAFAAGKVLQCSLEAMPRAGPQLGRTPLKSYLNACATSADTNEDNMPELERAYVAVTREAPAFQPAWARLLTLEAEYLDVSDARAVDGARARRTVALASKVNPAMPQILLARAALASPVGLTERMRLIEEAVGRAPDDPDIAASYAEYLMRVGRVQDAVREAERAVRLDPLSPTNRETLVSALGTAGRLTDAEQQLRQADALWPGALALRGARYTLSLRFGDPQEAIRLRDEGYWTPSAAPFQGSFLAARADPTPANVEKALRDARAFYSRGTATIFHLSQTLGEFGGEEELFPILLNWQYPDQANFVLNVLFRPALHNFRRDPRMMRVAARLGLLDYWRSSGKWPDFCFDPDMPYDCKREAAAVIAR